MAWCDPLVGMLGRGGAQHAARVPCPGKGFGAIKLLQVRLELGALIEEDF